MELSSEVCWLSVFFKASDVKLHVTLGKHDYFGILCASTQGQNFVQGLGHLGNDVI